MPDKCDKLRNEMKFCQKKWFPGKFEKKKWKLSKINPHIRIFMSCQDKLSKLFIFVFYVLKKTWYHGIRCVLFNPVYLILCQNQKKNSCGRKEQQLKINAPHSLQYLNFYKAVFFKLSLIQLSPWFPEELKHNLLTFAFLYI